MIYVEILGVLSLIVMTLLLSLISKKRQTMERKYQRIKADYEVVSGHPYEEDVYPRFRKIK